MTVPGSHRADENAPDALTHVGGEEVGPVTVRAPAPYTSTE